MTDYTTIRVSKDAKAKAQESKHDNETWNDYLQRCTDNPPVVEGGGSGVDVEQLADSVAHRIEESDYEDFDDWFSPDVARTIAQHVIDGMEYNTGPVQLEATEYRKIADAVTENLR